MPIATGRGSTKAFATMGVRAVLMLLFWGWAARFQNPSCPSAIGAMIRDSGRAGPFQQAFWPERQMIGGVPKQF